LIDAAETGDASLLYSAAVGGSATILETVDRARRQAPISSVTAVLNGTVNFILSRLAKGASFETALREAQKAGFAEEDCEADVSGADAAAKLRLIANRAFGVSPQSIEVSTEPLDEAAIARIGTSRWVQVARLLREENSIHAAVQLLPLSDVPELDAPADEWNCARIETVDGRTFATSGRGAGGAATAEAIVADLYDLVATPIGERVGTSAAGVGSSEASQAAACA
jgi:homoserine dehydrogenase